MFFQRSSRLFQLALNVKCCGVKFPWRPHPSLERARKFLRPVFTSSIKRPIRKFYVLQWRHRNVPKSVMYVQSCYFSYLACCSFDVFVAVAVVVAKAPYHKFLTGLQNHATHCRKKKKKLFVKCCPCAMLKIIVSKLSRVMLPLGNTSQQIDRSKRNLFSFVWMRCRTKKSITQKEQVSFQS